MQKLYGVIDIGSNTIRLVLYKLKGERLYPMLNKKVAAGLAAYIEKDGHMSRRGIEKTVEVLYEFSQALDNVNTAAVYAFATASLRNITNSREAVEEVADRSGFNIRVLTGEEEGVFDFYGAAQIGNTDSGFITDIGGGSTELVFYNDGEIALSQSLPVGSLNLFNNYVSDVIPTADEIRKIKRAVCEQLTTLRLPKCPVKSDRILTIGGSSRAAQALITSLLDDGIKSKSYRPDKLDRVFSLLTSNRKKLTKEILRCAPERIHTLLPGMAVLSAICQKFECEKILTSPYGVREGFLYYTLRQERQIEKR